jgi:hypothetical protein
MSWLTKRIQTERLRGKNKKKQAKGILLRLRARAGETVAQFRGEKGERI